MPACCPVKNKQFFPYVAYFKEMNTAISVKVHHVQEVTGSCNMMKDLFLLLAETVINDFSFCIHLVMNRHDIIANSSLSYTQRTALYRISSLLLSSEQLAHEGSLSSCVSHSKQNKILSHYLLMRLS